jgi:ubiquinone/menaquinone biosynthesis C-methylase UbiE
MKEKYDRIGIDYNQTRRADPYLTSRLYHHLGASPQGHYVDVGCGTGNYTIALHQKGGIHLTGVDPSLLMLEKAKANCSDIRWVQGSAASLPLKQRTMDGALASLTIHHWPELDQGMQSIYEVLKPAARFVLFTSTAEQMEGYWLNHYFPGMLRDSIQQMPRLEAILQSLDRAGFLGLQQEPYFVKDDLQDLFLYAGKNRPHLYLDPKVRSGISSFADLSRREEVESGLRQLEQDLASGQIHEVIARYENTLGDYLFVIASR